jgi:serine/threonine-protein kinase
MTLPTQIDRYQIRERLGLGGMGMLFLARDPAIDRLVALKVLRVDNPEVRERFEREARLAARLQHPNIVTVYDVGEHKGQPFIAMEYIPGETLGELIRRRAPLDVRRKLELMIEVCSGLAYAHKHGIIHRDIKPANLMVSRDSSILKVLDFGIARAGESALTQVGMVVGTPNYMSPEQIRGDAIDHRSDIFAVGLVLYELLSYRQAFTADTQPAVLMKILNEQPVPIQQIDPTIDPAIIRVVTKALAKSPADRYQDLAAMKADLVRIVHKLEAEPEDGRTIIVAPPPGRPGAVPTPPRGAPVAPPAAPAVDTSRTARVARHLSAAEQAIAAGDAETARAQLAMAAEVDPANPRLPEIRSKLQAAIAAREFARCLGEARTHIESGRLGEAHQLLGRARQIDPKNPELVATLQALEQAVARRSVNVPRPAPAAPPSASPSRPTTVLPQPPPRSAPPAEAAPPPAPRATPASTPPVPAAVPAVPPAQADLRAHGPSTPAAPGQVAPSSPAAAPPIRPPAPPPIPPPQALADVTSETPRPRTAGIPPAVVVLGAIAGAVLLVALVAWWWLSGGSAEDGPPSTPSSSTTTPSTPQTQSPPAGQSTATPGQATPPPASQAPATPATEAPVAPPTTAPAEDAAITNRLAAAVADFQGGRTPRALATLADLLDEAPQRDDLRLTAEQWAKSLRAQMTAVRASVPRPAGQLPQPMRRADQQARTAQSAFDAGDWLEAARGFEAARASWSQIAARRASRSEPAAPADPAATARPDAPAATPAPEPTRPAPSAEPPPQPAAAPITQQDLDKSAMTRLLQSFERAFESRSAESLKPIWPSLSPGQQQDFQQQFSRVLHQQWHFNSVTIGIDPEGKRASAISNVTITALPIGGRDQRSERKAVTFRFEKMGQMWVIAGVAGL